eukprot:s3789_g5.t1
MARSKYFRTMSASDEWQESRKGEVDFAGDAHVICLKSLVEKVDAAMNGMLNEDNLLQILAELHDTHSVVENSRWKMLESDSAILLQQEDLLDRLIAGKPTLARKLILLGRKKRPWQT